MEIAPLIRPLILKNRIQYYEWGMRGPRAFIPNLLGINAENEKPYAELWMGTHPAAPSQVTINNQLVELNEIIQQFPIDILGQSVYERFGANLPFLFKVLSAGQPLSIQAHPNKNQAAKLHTKDPIHYPDQNHKPEIAVALDELTVLIGLLTSTELSERLLLYPEVQQFTSISLTDIHNDFNESGEAIIRRFYSSLIKKANAEPQLFGKLIESLEAGFQERIESISELERLFLNLRKCYPVSDIGPLLALFMNLIHLTAGQSIFISAGIPHAYIFGNIIECMANSDNVVRVGLTNKFKDVSALLEIIDYKNQPIDIYKPEFHQRIVIYPSQVEEFQIQHLIIKNSADQKIDLNNRVQIILVISGQVDLIWNGREMVSLKRGQSALIPAAIKQYVLQTDIYSELYLATVN